MKEFEKGQDIWAVGIGSDAPYIIGPLKYEKTCGSDGLHWCKLEDAGDGDSVLLNEDRMVQTRRQALVLAKEDCEERIESTEEALLKIKAALADFCIEHNIK